MNLTKYICPYRKKYFNKRTSLYQYTDCGYCDVCASKKNARNFGILEQANADYRYKLFITLTYSNEYLPTAELVLDKQNNIYKPVVISERCKNFELYGSITNDSESIKKLDRFFKENHTPGSQFKRFGFIFYKDVQNFFKRVRINFLRQFGKKMDFKYFVLSEYGAKYFRPHYHIVIFSNDREIQDYFFQRYRECPKIKSKHLLSDWSFGFADCQRPKNDGEVASYVGGYVAAVHRVHEILSFSSIRPNTKKSSGLCSVVPRRLLTDKDFYLSLPVEDIKNVVVEYPLERTLLFDDANSFNTLFPKIPTISINNLNDLYSVLKNFKRFSNETTKQLIARNSSNESFMFYYSWIVRHAYELYPDTDDKFKVDNYVINCVRSISKVANHYSSQITDFVSSYKFLNKLQEIWDFFDKHRLATYFSLLSVLPYPCLSVVDGSDDYYSKASFTIMHDKQKKALAKKKHNDKVHKSI